MQTISKEGDAMKTLAVSSAASRQNKGFTLIELLVVIVIMAILSSLILAAVSAARRYADLTRARAEVQAIKTAWTAYQHEYQRWPAVPGNPNPEVLKVKIGGNIARTLQGEDLDNNNPRKVNLVTFQRLTPAGDPINSWYAVSAGTWPDEAYYYCKFDVHYNHIVDGTGDENEPPKDSVRQDVIVWTINPNYPVGERRRLVASWQ
jgi:prepilin-type N-terminal cleavage/methylation domain-containing protein